MITREVGKTDWRTFIVTLTAKGRKLAHRISSHLLELEREVARGVTATEIKGFKKVVAALEQQAHYRAQR